MKTLGFKLRTQLSDHSRNRRHPSFSSDINPVPAIDNFVFTTSRLQSYWIATAMQNVIKR